MTNPFFKILHARPVGLTTLLAVFLIATGRRLLFWPTAKFDSVLAWMLSWISRLYLSEEDSVCNQSGPKAFRESNRRCAMPAGQKLSSAQKESVFKALNPLTSEVPDFKDVAVFLNGRSAVSAMPVGLPSILRQDLKVSSSLLRIVLGAGVFTKVAYLQSASVTVDLWYMRLEETVMRETFGAEYDAYCREMRGGCDVSPTDSISLCLGAPVGPGVGMVRIACSTWRDHGR